VIVSPRPRAARTAQYVALACYIFFLGFPLLWMLSVSLKGPRELVELHPHLIPQNFTLANFGTGLHEYGMLHDAWNSFKVASLTAVIVTVIAIPAAYVLARQRGLISKLGLGWILLSQMFPLILIIIPLFLVLRDLHLVDSHSGLVFVYVVWTLPFVLWMLQSYVRGIPRDLEEAAMVDGAGRFGVLRTVIAPLLAPGIVVTALFAFIQAWNEYIMAYVLLRDPSKQTLTVWLASFSGDRGTAWGPLMAGATLTALPVVIFFVAVQRKIAFGLTAGAVRG
jgi:multiple sugar transport system permease protein